MPPRQSRVAGKADSGKRIKRLPWQQALRASGSFGSFLSVETYGYFNAGGSAIYDTGSGELIRSSTAACTACWAGLCPWSLLLQVGDALAIPSAGYAAAGYFFVTVLKVIFLDMADLPGLYRVLAFLVLAVMMGLGAWAYQRFQRHRTTGSAEVNDHA